MHLWLRLNRMTAPYFIARELSITKHDTACETQWAWETKLTSRTQRAWQQIEQDACHLPEIDVDKRLLHLLYDIACACDTHPLTGSGFVQIMFVAHSIIKKFSGFALRRLSVFVPSQGEKYKCFKPGCGKDIHDIHFRCYGCQVLFDWKCCTKRTCCCNSLREALRLSFIEKAEP